MKAYYRDRNLYLSNADGSGEVALSTDGDEKKRIKYGVGSWVYGEELGQTTAIWWSPDATKVGFYRFDESPVKDYFLQMDQTQVHTSLDVEAYPKAGTDNPIADVLVYDIATKKSTTLDIRDGKPFTNDVVGHYVYAMQWAADGTELLMNRTNRRQQVMELVGCAPATGEVPRHRARGMADRLGGQPAADAAARGREAVHLGIRSQRLDQLLPLRSERQADQPDHDAHDVRSRRDRQAG